MRPQLSARDQRVAALVLLGLVIAAAYWLLVHSWFVGPLLAANQQLSDLMDQHQHYSALLGQRETLQRQVQEARLRSSDTQALLPGEDSGVVAGDLMQQVVEQVKRLEAVGPGCKVTQRMPMSAERVAQELPYQRVTLSLDLECAIEPLTRLLHALEYARPLLFVEELTITRAAQARQEQGTGRLSVHLLVAGYMAAQAPATPAATDDAELPDEAPAQDPPFDTGDEQ
ncbi:MAG TPA: type II secretion system protein GspM [Pseudomonas sp.]|uniref:type II secretion system protein GspM n=1 Tax=Pseudomonas sp. TaxID=306 RepID=UPI002B49BE70|nr:type II secretion system protein GspM [Pseudomonas sp.]HKS13361.1 type II secretion system protein GspM [Pseudomonas sp.]